MESITEKDATKLLWQAVRRGDELAVRRLLGCHNLDFSNDDGFPAGTYLLGTVLRRNLGVAKLLMRDGRILKYNMCQHTYLLMKLAEIGDMECLDIAIRSVNQNKIEWDLILYDALRAGHDELAWHLVKTYGIDIEKLYDIGEVVRSEPKD